MVFVIEAYEVSVGHKGICEFSFRQGRDAKEGVIFLGMLLFQTPSVFPVLFFALFLCCPFTRFIVTTELYLHPTFQLPPPPPPPSFSSHLYCHHSSQTSFPATGESIKSTSLMVECLHVCLSCSSHLNVLVCWSPRGQALTEASHPSQSHTLPLRKEPSSFSPFSGEKVVLPLQRCPSSLPSPWGILEHQFTPFLFWIFIPGPFWKIFPTAYKDILYTSLSN